MKVFISSRFGEFKEIRKKLVEDLPIANFQPIDLNDNAAVAETPIDRSLNRLRESKAIILLIGDTYGTIPTGYEKSYTHIEYEEAFKNKIKVYPYFIGNTYREDVMIYSKDDKLRSLQEDIDKNFTYACYPNKNDVDLIVNNIITNIYEGINKVWLDEDTGLIWQVKVESWSDNGGKYSWWDRQVPVDITNKNRYGNFSDWRVPTFEELKSLIDDKIHHSCHSNYEGFRIKKPLVYSMTMHRGRFWTSTENPRKTDCAYAVYFNRERPNSKSEKGEKPKSELAYVRCVRLWMFEDVKKEWERIRKEENVNIVKRFVEKYKETKSPYVSEANNILKQHKQNEQEAYTRLTPFERKMKDLYNSNKNNTKSSILVSAIEHGEFGELRGDAIRELESVMKEEGCWKESTNAKRPEKDKNYQKTLRAKKLRDE